ncbi:MAG: radical SAM protein [Bacillota bacterium]
MIEKNGQSADSLENILDQAWQARRANFTSDIEFVSPGRTLPVSVTGDQCALNCAHCSGVYLRSMVPIDKALAGENEGKQSYLVSGGSDRYGKVPLLEHWAGLQKLAERGSLNLHTGLVSEEEADRLSKLASVVSFDFIGDNQTINEVYGLAATVDDYLESYRLLQRYTRVIPHLCIGLNGGTIRGEYRALHLLKDENVEAISMIIFRPTAGTAFSKCSPPPVDQVAYFIASARLMFPRTPIYLGCMRPGGRYREKVDIYAIKSGMNKLVLPSPAARRQAAIMGLTVNYSEECCSL